jgi:hypothetical protein
VAVHLLVGNGRMPVVTADAAEVVDQPVTYLRLQTDDAPRSGSRHTVDISISGPPADVAALVARLGEAVAAAEPHPSPDPLAAAAPGGASGHRSKGGSPNGTRFHPQARPDVDSHRRRGP